MMERIKQIKLTRTQKLIRNSILLVLVVAVLLWTFGGDYKGYKTSDEALAAAFNDLGMAPPYDIVSDYIFEEGESSYGREIAVRSTMNGETVIVWIPIRYDRDENRWHPHEPITLKRADFFTAENVSLWTQKKPEDRDWMYFTGGVGYLGFGRNTYGMLLETEEYVTIQLDCLNDYGNSLSDDGRLENFSPDISFNYDRKTEEITRKEESVRCRILDMQLTDEQAVLAARKLVELYDEWSMEAE